jgi:hypothetical protein
MKIVEHRDVLENQNGPKSATIFFGYNVGEFVKNAIKKTVEISLNIKNEFRPFVIYDNFSYPWGTRYRNLLSHYATSRKNAGSIPDEVIEFFC